METKSRNIPSLFLFSALVVLLAVLVGCGGGSSSGGPPPQTGGNLAVSITGLPNGTAASVTVTGPNGYSKVLSATQTLSQLSAGNYTIVGSGVLIANSNYFPSVTSQTVAVSNGTTASAQVAYTVVAPVATKILDQVGSQSLVVSPDGSTLTISASSPVAQSLAPGDVLAIGVTPATPNGALRKIASVTQSGSQIIATTNQATLGDAFQQANFTFQTKLGPQNFQRTKPLLPGVKLVQGKRATKARRSAQVSGSLSDPCTDSSVTFLELINVPLVQDGSGTLSATGQIEVCPSLQFNWSIGGTPPTLQSLTSTLTFGADLHVNVTGRYDKSFDQKIPILTTMADPITVFVGPVPIVLTPTLTFFVGASGDLTAGFSAGATQTATVTGGISYSNGQVSPVFNNTSNFGTDPLGLDAGFSAKAFAGVTLDLEVDGVLSPEFSPDAFLNLDVSPLNNPWWSLSGGLEGSASVSVGIFGFNLADFDFPDLFQFSKTIAQADGAFLTSDAAPGLNTLTPDNTPVDAPGLVLTLSGSNFVPGAVVSFNGAPLQTTFGTPLSLTAVLPAGALTTPGAFPVTVTNPDASGAVSSSLTFTVTGSSGNPVPSIVSLFPPSLPVGSSPQLLTINGTGFVISSSVTYNGTAHTPTFVNSTQLTISLTSADLSNVGSFPVMVTNPPPGGGTSNTALFSVTSTGGVTVSISPSSVVLPPSGTQTFTATVTGTSNTNVTWSVQEGASGGTITGSGVYTAPTSTGTFHVVATSQADTTKSATATVDVITGSGKTPRFVFVANGDTTVSRFYVDGTTGQLRSAGALSLGSNAIASGTAVDPAGKFAYLADFHGSIYGFSIGANGTLTAVPGSPFVVPSSNTELVALNVHPSGNFIYASDDNSNGLWAYAIDSASGTLSLVSGSPFLTGSLPGSTAFDTSGKFLFVANAGAGLAGFSVNQTTGALTSVAGSGCGGGGLLPLSVVVEPSGKFVYCEGFGEIDGFQIDPASGALTSIGSWGGVNYSGLAVDPQGKYLYASGNGGGIASFTIDANTGALTPVAGSPFATILGVNQSLAVSSTGDRLYAVQDSYVAAVSINQADGTLTSLNYVLARDTLAPLYAPKEITIAQGSSGLNIMPAFAYIANASDQTISGFSVAPSTGLLTSLGSAIPVGNNPHSITTDSLGRYLYVANQGDNSVSAFAINASNGALTALSGSPYSVGAQPAGLALDAGGQFLYVANAGDNTISQFIVNQVTGALTSMGNADVSSLACQAPQSLVVDPRGFRLHLVCANSPQTLSIPFDPSSGNLFVYGSVWFGHQGGSSIGFHPSGQFVYVVDPVAQTIDEFTVSQTGVLTAGPVGPIGVNQILASDPLGRFLYGTDSLSNSVQADTIDASGALTQVAGSPFSSGTFPTGVTVDPAGKYLYVVNTNSNSLSAFAINASTGSLTALSPPTIQVGAAPSAVIVVPSVQ